MKKITKMLLCIFFFIISITTVCAKSDTFELGWSKKITSKADHIMYLGYTRKVTFGDGYVVSKINIDDERTSLIYYNYNGEVIKEAILENKGVVSLKEYDGSLYALSLSDTDNSSEEMLMVLSKLNDNLEEVATETISFGEEFLPFLSYIPFFVNYVGIDYISTVDDRITVLGSTKTDLTLTHFDKNLKNKEVKVLKNNDIEYGAKYYPIVTDFMNLMELTSDNRIPEQITILSEEKNNMQIHNGAELSQCELLFRIKDAVDNNENLTEIDLPQCYINSKLKLTNDNNVVFDKIYENYLLLINARIIDNYIVAIGLKNIGNITDYINKGINEDLNALDFNIQTDIVVLNMDGEIVQTISKGNNHYLEIIPSKNGFAVSKFALDVSILDVIKGTATEKVTFDIFLEHYNLQRNVNTKVKGNGSILVTDKMRAGEMVKFEISPEKGYVLGTIKITDANGNVIERNENTFLMPESEVTIEVSFVPENPETKDIAIICVCIIFIIGLACTIINYRKVNFLR